MEDVAYKLASLCVMSKAAAPADPRKTRDDFESSAEKEKVLRRHAGRLGDLAKRRADEEDTSPAGYAGTTVGRMMPIPHTGAEALVRGAGGLAGYHVGKQFETPNQDAIKRVFSGGRSAPMSRAVDAIARNAAMSSDDARGLMDHLSTQSPGTLKEVFGGTQRRMPTLNEVGSRVTNLGKARSLGDLGRRAKGVFTMPASQKPMSESGRTLRDHLHSNVDNFARRNISSELKNVLNSSKDLPAASKLPRYLGAGAGVLAAGVPFAARALYQKHMGGEAAVRARSQMNKAISAADSEANQREKMLSTLPSTAQVQA